MYTVSMMHLLSKYQTGRYQNMTLQLSDADARRFSTVEIENNILHDYHKLLLNVVEHSKIFQPMSYPCETTASHSRLTVLIRLRVVREQCTADGNYAHSKLLQKIINLMFFAELMAHVHYAESAMVGYPSHPITSLSVILKTI